MNEECLFTGRKETVYGFGIDYSIISIVIADNNRMNTNGVVGSCERVLAGQRRWNVRGRKAGSALGVRWLLDAKMVVRYHDRSEESPWSVHLVFLQSNVLPYLRSAPKTPDTVFDQVVPTSATQPTPQSCFRTGWPHGNEGRARNAQDF